MFETCRKDFDPTFGSRITANALFMSVGNRGQIKLKSRFGKLFRENVATEGRMGTAQSLTGPHGAARQPAALAGPAASCPPPPPAGKLPPVQRRKLDRDFSQEQSGVVSEMAFPSDFLSPIRALGDIKVSLAVEPLEVVTSATWKSNEFRLWTVSFSAKRGVHSSVRACTWNWIFPSQ